MLRLFGNPQFELGSTAGALPAKAYALIALLSTNPGRSLDREGVAALLWDGDNGANLTSLRVMLNLIRKWEQANDVTVVKSDARRVWRDSECVAVDLEEFTGLRRVVSATDLTRATDLFRGDLLDGLSIQGADDFERWLAEARNDMAAQFRRMVLASVTFVQDDVVDVALGRLSRMFPFDEEIERARLIRSGHVAGQASVSRQYASFRDRLDREMGAEPQLETQALVMQLLDRPTDGAPLGTGAPLSRSAVNASRPMVLIMPPANGGENLDGNIVASLVDDITINLCKLRTFAVFAPHTARQLAKSAGTANLAAYGTDYVFDTRLLPSAKQGELRLGVSLTKLSTHEILFGDDFYIPQEAWATRHAQIAATIVRTVAQGIEKSERFEFRKTGSASSYVHYLLGLDNLQSLDLPTVRKARKAFRRAQELSPDFAPAASMISRTLSLEWLLLGRLDNDLLVQAHQFGKLAVEIDPLDPQGHRELGNVAVYRHDLDEGLHHLQTAQDRAPHHADIIQNVADALVHNSDAAAAKPLMDAAMALNPLPPDEYYWIAATIEFFLRDYNAALNLLWKMQNPQPAARFVAATAAMAGDLPLARRYRDMLMQRQPDFKLAEWRKLMPLRSEVDKDMYVDALRLAGFN